MSIYIIALEDIMINNKEVLKDLESASESRIKIGYNDIDDEIWNNI